MPGFDATAVRHRSSQHSTNKARAPRNTNVHYCSVSSTKHVTNSVITLTCVCVACSLW